MLEFILKAAIFGFFLYLQLWAATNIKSSNANAWQSTAWAFSWFLLLPYWLVAQISAGDQGTDAYVRAHGDFLDSWDTIILMVMLAQALFVLGALLVSAWPLGEGD